MAHFRFRPQEASPARRAACLAAELEGREDQAPEAMKARELAVADQAAVKVAWQSPERL
jgi:hypothetical protein